MINDNGESREEVLSTFESLKKLTNKNITTVSLLDPVLSEVMVRWFGIDGGNVIDPFAGDTIFGYVSSKLGMNFTGIEIRKEQAELNNSRVQGMTARYINDDGQNVLKHIEKNSQDMIFSCPPYFDLEVYSDLENDASNQGDYNDFLKILRNAFTGACECLKDNRFAVIVCGDVRDKKGFYRNMVSDIKQIFFDAGLHLYNELILLDPIGHASLRAAGTFRNRKMVHVHQNVLVMYKGNPQEIKNNYKDIRYESKDLERFGMDQADE